MKSSIALIANPAARKASEKKIKAASKAIEKRGLSLKVFLTEKRGDGTLLALKALDAGASLIIAAGGDGTFNEAANAMAGSDAAMAILPMGTTNVLAKELGVPEKLSAAVETALSGRVHRVSLGRISYNSSSRFFLLMAGIGFDGASVYGVHKKIKKYSGKGGYILSGLRTLISWKPDKLDVKVDGRPYECYSLIVCNGAKYGGHFRAAPDACMENPELYAVLMHGRRRLDIVRYFSGIVTGRHTAFKDITYVKCASVEVAGDAHMHADGDYIGKSPAAITVQKNALSLIY